MDDVLVDERAGRRMRGDDAGAEDDGKRERDRGARGERAIGKTGQPDRRALVNRADESIAAPRYRLKPFGVGAERDADLPDGVVDALVVVDDRIGPDAGADRLARHDGVRALDEQIGRASW